MRHSKRLLATGLVSAALLLSTVAFAGAATSPKSAPGVTATKVNVGAIVSESGPVAADFKPYLDGVNAYFDYVNSLGKINGRSIDLAYPLDDTSSPSQDISDATTLVTADHVFAIVGVSTPFFDAHTYLAKTGTPTFGYATGNVWGPYKSGSKTIVPKNLFADYGSVLDFNSSIPEFAYVAKQTKSTKIAVVALGYASSKDECQGALTGLAKYKYKVVYSNTDESIGQNWQIEATKIQRSGADMVISCMDVNSSIELSKQLKLYESKPPVQLWLDGYDRTILKANAQYMANVYLIIQHVPFEAAAEFPTSFPGMNLYLKEMVKYGYSGDEYDDVALAGWESANLFTEGLRAAGKNPTQTSLIDAINKIKDDFGGPDGGVAAPTNWTIAHSKDTSPGCEAFVVVKGSAFEPAFNHGTTHMWTCFPLTGTANLSKPVNPPAGTPGA